MVLRSYIRSLSAVVVVALLPGGCTEIINPNCADRGYGEYSGYSAVLDVRDAEGRPAALGTTVRLTGSGVDESVKGTIPGDSILAIGREAGRFTVEVTRPWWISHSIAGVVSRETAPRAGRCGGTVVPVALDVVLELRPGAPAVRQVVPERHSIRVVSNPPYTVSGGAGEWQLDAWLEADPTASSAIDWESSDPDIARITPDGLMTVSCRESRAETAVVARSRADPDVSAAVHVTVDRTQLWECPGG